MSTAARARIKSLLAANERLDRRIHDLHTQLLASVPMRAYSLLTEKYNMLVAHRRQVALDSNQAIVGADNTTGSLERQLAQVEQLYVAACARAAAAEEAVRVSEGNTPHKSGSEREAELLGDLKQRATELDGLKVQAEAYERKIARRKEDLRDIEGQLKSVQEAYAGQAKRAPPFSHRLPECDNVTDIPASAMQCSLSSSPLRVP